MLLSAKTGRVRETTPLRRLSHKFEEMKNRVIIHRLPPFYMAMGRRAKRNGGSENQSRRNLEMARENTSALRRLFFFCRRPADYFFMSKGEKSIVIIKLWSCISIIGFVQFIISNSFFTM